MMARIDKSLLKLWVWFVTCIFAYNPEPLAGESPDIDVAVTIPELALPGGVVSTDILKFCRLIMYTIPMDTYSSDNEKNFNSSIPVTSYSRASSVADPLQFLTNRKLMRNYFGGRNVVVTQDKTMARIIVVTGMGPKYNSTQRQAIEGRIGTRVIDIVDVLPGLSPEKRTAMRNEIMHYKLMLVLRSILQQGVDENAFDEVKKLMEQNAEIKKIMEGSRAIKDFAETLTKDPDATIASSLFENEIAQLNSLLEIEKLQILSIEFMKKLTELVDGHLAPQKSTALQELRKVIDKLHKEPEYAAEVIYQVTSLDEGTINSSLTGLKLVDPVEKGHQQALGDLFHSEPLYLLWRIENPEAKPYFFTQRDMCPACDLHICCNALKKKLPPNFTVLSAKAGNSAGAASIDGIFYLQDSSWSSFEMIPLEDSTVFQIISGYPQRLKGKGKKEELKTEQLSAIKRWRLPDLYITIGTEAHSLPDIDHAVAGDAAASSSAQPSRQVDSADESEEKSSESKEPKTADAHEKLPVAEEDTPTSSEAPETSGSLIDGSEDPSSTPGS